jgi:hypothetical protein
LSVSLVEIICRGLELTSHVVKGGGGVSCGQAEDLPTHPTHSLHKTSRKLHLQNLHSFYQHQNSYNNIFAIFLNLFLAEVVYTGASLIPHMGFTDSSHHSNNYWIWLNK